MMMMIITVVIISNKEIPEKKSSNGAEPWGSPVAVIEFLRTVTQFCTLVFWGILGSLGLFGLFGYQDWLKEQLKLFWYLGDPPVHRSFIFFLLC